MRLSIAKRLFAALIITSLVIVALNALATRWSFQQGFVAYLNAQESSRIQAIVGELGEMYAEDGSWDRLKNDPRSWDELIKPRRGKRGGPDRRRPGPGGPRGRPPLGDLANPPSRIALLDENGVFVAGQRPNEPATHTFVIDVDGAAVGKLLVRTRAEISDAVDVEFARQQSKAIVLIGIGILLLAALIAAIVAKQLVRPITTLTRATQALTLGDYEQNITVTRDDEIGDLARDFNRLAQTLNRDRAARQQWASDISHELRTPLAILSGELQAIEDGVRTFDAGTRASLQSEVQRLSQLVSDLHQLTLSDESGLQYQFRVFDLAGLLDDILEPQRARIEAAGLALSIQHADTGVEISIDERRFEQLMTNLIENSLRYTDKPGRLEIRYAGTDDSIEITVADSSPSVSAADRERLFDRLYRVDPSRNRGTGGSGLGLAIAAAIVAGHDGTIVAESTELGGLAIKMQFPIANRESTT